MKTQQKLDMVVIQKKFNELKGDDAQLRATEVQSIIKSLFKSACDNDFQNLFSLYREELQLNTPHKFISLPELKYIYLSLSQIFNRNNPKTPYGLFFMESHVQLSKKSKVNFTKMGKKNQHHTFNILTKELSEIVPYEVIFFDSLYRRQEKQGSLRSLEKLTQQNLQPYYCYKYKVYETMLENYDGSCMNKLERFFYMVVDFRWIEGLELLKKEIILGLKINQAQYLLPILQNLKYIQEQINKNGQTLKGIFQKRKNFQLFFNESIKSPQLISKANQLKNILSFVTYFCQQIYKQLSNPYLKLAIYFLGKESSGGQSFQQILNSNQIGVMVKFLFARRFLSQEKFSAYYKNLLYETKSKPKLQHIMFVKTKTQVVQIISSYWDQNPTELEKVALTCGIVLSKIGKGFNKDYPFLQQMIRLYEQLLVNLQPKQTQKQYMIKLMSIRSSKQPTWQQLLIKPQFKLNCENRGDDCIFISMLEKFLYGGQEKWNKLKNKSNISDPSKKHYQVEAKHCPYCNYPTPTCPICLDNIKIYTVKSYLNQQIKKKVEKQQKPYMKLNDSLEDALIWCPSCSHGGHFGHLQSWFKENMQCRVDGCQCKCRY